MAVATGVLTLVILLCGEIVPKTWAMLSSEKIALAYCVANQNGAQHLAVAFQNLVDLCRAFAALFFKGAHADTVRFL